jgi:CO/xanthine dehydrogenase Mo-binding subunit
MVNYSYIGKNVPRIDALAKATGEAIFTDDMNLPGVLCGRIKTSPYPFARILSVNTERARKLPGVRAVISAQNVMQFPYGPRVRDELALADAYVRYIGDAVAAVAASDPDLAEEALELIDVEYEPLSSVIDLELAMAAGTPPVHPERENIKNNITYHLDFVRGEGEAAFLGADVILEERFRTQTVHQAYLEPQVAIAQWDVSGRLNLWGCTQGVFVTRRMVAMALGIAEDRIRVVQPYIGGGFGGKLWLLTHFIICALLSKEAGRAVKVVYSRKDEFLSGRPRISQIIDLKMGFKKDGTILAKSSIITADSGAYTGFCPPVVLMSAIRPDCVYRLPNIKLVANLVYTNTTPRGPFRGFGNPQMHYAMETMIDMAAEKLGIDPIEIRLKNSSQKGDTTVHGWILNSCGLDETIMRAAEGAEWRSYQRKKKPHHGIGVACQVHVAGNRAVHPLYDGSAALVIVDRYGKARVISGEIDLGQGATTIFAQIAAEELGLNINDVEVLPSADTDISPYCHGTYADRVTVLGGNAVMAGARDARKQILQHVSRRLGISSRSIVIRDSRIYRTDTLEEVATLSELANTIILQDMSGVPIIGRGEYQVPDYVVPPDEGGYGNFSVSYTFGTVVAEVSVDVETGKVKVLNIWYSINIGKALNPKMCEGQIEGGVLQGIGYALSEHYVWHNGVLLNPSFTDYKIPLPDDMPTVHSLWIEQPNPGSPYGAKGLGEPVLNPIAPAIANAIYNAVGVRVNALPITPEKLLAVLNKKRQ